MAFALTWDSLGEKFYEAGTKRGVLYPMSGTAYSAGVVWNGLTSVSDSPEGGEANDIWADDIKYGSIRSTEKAKLSVEAYTYPEEFAECDGSVAVAKGVYIGQQPRKNFGFSYVSSEFDDVGGEFYKIHIAYGCSAAPSQKQYQTISDSPDAMTFSWDFETTPVNVDGHRPTATIEIDSRTVDPDKLTALENILYGVSGDQATEARLPLPNEIITLFNKEGTNSTEGTNSGEGTGTNG